MLQTFYQVYKFVWEVNSKCAMSDSNEINLINGYFTVDSAAISRIPWLYEWGMNIHSLEWSLSTYLVTSRFSHTIRVSTAPISNDFSVSFTPKQYLPVSWDISSKYLPEGNTKNIIIYIHTHAYIKINHYLVLNHRLTTMGCVIPIQNVAQI